MPSTATTTQHNQQHHHTYKSEEEEEDQGREFHVHRAQRTATVMHSNTREATSSHDQEKHPYGELLLNFSLCCAL
jgi:hypothetical protein